MTIVLVLYFYYSKTTLLMSKSIQSVLRRNIVVCILYAGIRSLLSEEGGVERGREGERGGGRGVICSGQAYRSGELTVLLLALSCKTLAGIRLCKIHVIIGLKIFFYYYFLDSPRSESNMNDMNTHWQSLDRR